MGLFSSEKKIKRPEFRKAIKDIPHLSLRERQYIKGFFQDSLKDGISKRELKREMQRLRKNPHDQLDSFEVKKIKEKLTKTFKK